MVVVCHTPPQWPKAEHQLIYQCFLLVYLTRKEPPFCQLKQRFELDSSREQMSGGVADWHAAATRREDLPAKCSPTSDTA